MVDMMDITEIMVEEEDKGAVMMVKIDINNFAMFTPLTTLDFQEGFLVLCVRTDYDHVFENTKDVITVIISFTIQLIDMVMNSVYVKIL